MSADLRRPTLAAGDRLAPNQPTRTIALPEDSFSAFLGDQVRKHVAKQHKPSSTERVYDGLQDVFMVVLIVVIVSLGFWMLLSD
jgi:hypothetical protein